MSDVVSEPGRVLVRGEWRLDWDEIGEGWSGDYDPDDPEDEELLRFTFFRLEDGEWAEVDDASYCTRVPVDTDLAERQRLLEVLLEELVAAAEHGGAKRRAEELSWVGPGDLYPCDYPNCVFFSTTVARNRHLCATHAEEFAESLGEG